MQIHDISKLRRNEMLMIHARTGESCGVIRFRAGEGLTEIEDRLAAKIQQTHCNAWFTGLIDGHIPTYHVVAGRSHGYPSYYDIELHNAADVRVTA
jgi:hypothetical protein